MHTELENTKLQYEAQASNQNEYVMVSVVTAKFFGLQDQAMKRANKLSGGQQQRVAIARALINSPKIIMGDEPTGNLDSKNAQIVFDILKELKENFNQSILIVTHDMNFASKTDRIITLHDGEVAVR